MANKLNKIAADRLQCTWRIVFRDFHFKQNCESESSYILGTLCVMVYG